MYDIKLSAFSIMILYLMEGMHAQLYEWRCSPLDAANNRYTLPDLGITSDTDVANIGNRNLLESNGDEIFIFPLPSTLNCGGSVSAVQYCYELPRSTTSLFGIERLLFTLLLLEENGLNFTVIDTIPVIGTPTSQTCTRHHASSSNLEEYCCDILHLEVEDRFYLPAPNSAFGTRHDFLYSYDPSQPENGHRLVQQYRLNAADLPIFAIGETFSLDKNIGLSVEGLRLLQFFITPTSMPITSPDGSKSSTEQDAGPDGSISSLATEQDAGSRTSVRPSTASTVIISANGSMAVPSLTTEPGAVMPQPGTEAEADGTGQFVQGVGIGAAVGGAVAMALVVVIIILVVTKVMKCKSSSTTAQGTATGGTNGRDFERSTTNIAYNWHANSGGSGGYGGRRVEHEYDYPNEVIEAAPNHTGTDLVKTSLNQAYGAKEY